jgi:phosphohistidine phosphatase
VCALDKSVIAELRARQTAELLAPHVASDAIVEAVAGLHPNDSVETMADRIAGWSDDALLVGHLPFLARLAARLLGASGERPVIAFHPGSNVCLCLERDAAGRWAIVCMLGPELLPSTPIAGLNGGPLLLAR